MLFVVFYGVLASIYFVTQGRPEVLRRPSDVLGAVVGVAMLSMAVLPIVGTKLYLYELFYITYVGAFVIVIIATSLHELSITHGVVGMTAVAGGL